MSRTKHTPLDRLKHHVTGAIERGEAKAIEAVVAPKHTPGPWTFDAMGVVCGKKIVGEPAPVVVRDFSSFADARLIAAAPELLEALQGVIDFLAEYTGHDAWQEIIGATKNSTGAPAVMDALAVIAKATGGAE